jgi:RNA polymerase sigma factor (sigma-70 family)
MDLSKYYEEICREPMLSKEEEEDLFRDLEDAGLTDRQKTKIRDRIIRSHLRFVFKQAKYFSKNDPTLFKELISAGNEGLLVGMQKFDLGKGMRFLTYAGYWVNQRILKQMASLRIVSLPIWKQQLAAKIQRYCDTHEHVTLELLKEAFPDVKEKDLSELFQTKYLTYYIEDLGEDPAFEINPIETEVEQRLDKKWLHEVVDGLPELHKQVVCLSYGLLDGLERKHTEVAKELSLSKERFKEIKKEALAMLKEKMGPESPI